MVKHRLKKIAQMLKSTCSIASVALLWMVWWPFGCTKQPTEEAPKEDVVRVLCDNHVLSADIGIESMGGLFNALLSENDALPVGAHIDVSTFMDNQPAVDVRLLQGYSCLAHKNLELVTYRLTNIPPLPRGVPQIRLRLNVDEQGVLSVAADELYSGKKLRISTINHITVSSERSKTLKQQALASMESDRSEAALIDAKLKAEMAVYQAERLLSGQTNISLSTDEKVDLKSLVEELTKTQSCSSPTEIVEGTTKLNSLLNRILSTD